MRNNIIYETRQFFPIHKDFQSMFSHKVSLGEKYASQKNVLILTLARNIEHKVNYSLKIIKDLCQKFSQHRVFIYENDSTDDTVNSIKDIINYDTYANFSVFTEVLETEALPMSKHTYRTKQMARARNKCYQLACETFPDFQHHLVLVIDIDFLNTCIDGLMNSLGWLSDHPEMSAICGNSYQFTNPYNLSQYHNYDSFAFRLNYWDYYDMPWFPHFSLPIGSKPIPVNSAFGGAAFYRSKFYADNYLGNDCEHVTFHKYIKNQYPEFQLFCNPSQIMLLD